MIVIVFLFSCSLLTGGLEKEQQQEQQDFETFLQERSGRSKRVAVAVPSIISRLGAIELLKSVSSYLFPQAVNVPAVMPPPTPSEDYTAPTIKAKEAKKTMTVRTTNIDRNVRITGQNGSVDVRQNIYADGTENALSAYQTYMDQVKTQYKARSKANVQTPSIRTTVLTDYRPFGATAGNSQIMGVEQWKLENIMNVWGSMLNPLNSYILGRFNEVFGKLNNQGCTNAVLFRGYAFMGVSLELELSCSKFAVIRNSLDVIPIILMIFGTPFIIYVAVLRVSQ